MTKYGTGGDLRRKDHWGPIERYILDRIARRPEELIPVLVLAHLYAGEHEREVTPALRASFRRAASNLLAARQVFGYDVLAPTRLIPNGAKLEPYGYRWTATVGRLGIEPTEEVVQDAVMAVTLIVAQ